MWQHEGLGNPQVPTTKPPKIRTGTQHIDEEDEGHGRHARQHYTSPPNPFDKSNDNEKKIHREYHDDQSGNIIIGQGHV